MAKITSNLSISDCTSLPNSGVTGPVYLVDYDDWLACTVSEDETTKDISDITPPSGVKFVKYDLTRGGAVLTNPLTVNAGGKSGFIHTAEMFVPTKLQKMRSELMPYINFKRLVAIFLLDGYPVARVYGRELGLVVSVFDEPQNDPAMGGGFKMTLTTPGDTTMETLPPYNLLKTDRAVTLELLESLLTAS